MDNPFQLEFHSLLEKADKIRQSKWGKKVFFVRNLHLNYTNICVSHCKFCAFAKNKNEDGSYNMTPDDAVKYVSQKGSDACEIHIVGGLHPDYPFEYYIDMVHALKTNFPEKTIKAFSAVEIDYFSRISGKSISEVLEALKKAGVEMMPGGGAEIFAGHVRKQICPEKIPASRWLEIHETAHNTGLTTNATMLYGHLENDDDKFQHLLLLRELQEKFHATGIEDIRTISCARIVLENIPHIKSYWVMLGHKTAQTALRAGADDLDGTIVKENIAYAAGKNTDNAMTAEQLVFMVKSAGMVAVERDSFYREVKIYG